MRQAPRFDGLSFGPFPMSQNGLPAPEADICGREVLQTPMIAPVIAVIDEGIDLLSKITRQAVVFQQAAVLQGLVPALGPAPGLRMIRCAPDMFHVLILQPFGQLPGM